MRRVFEDSVSACLVLDFPLATHLSSRFDHILIILLLFTPFRLLAICSSAIHQRRCNHGSPLAIHRPRIRNRSPPLVPSQVSFVFKSCRPLDLKSPPSNIATRVLALRSHIAIFSPLVVLKVLSRDARPAKPTESQFMTFKGLLLGMVYVGMWL